MSDYNKDQETKDETTKFDNVPIMPRKKAQKWIYPAIGVSFIVVTAILFYFLSPTAINTLARVTMSPSNYYQKIETANLETQIDKLSIVYGNYIDAYKKTMDHGTSSKTTISATLDSSITTNLGLRGLNTIKSSINSSVIGLSSKSTMVISSNEKDITSLDYYLDMESENFYIQIPDLSESYVKASFAVPTNGIKVPLSTKDIYGFLNKNPLSEKLLNNILKKYTQIAIDELNNVTIDKKEMITADKISTKYTKISVNIDKKTALSIAEKIFNTAKMDAELRDLFIQSNLCTKEEYEAFIQDNLDDIEDEKTSVNEEDLIIMTVLVDNKGDITGRDFTIKRDEKTDTFGYKTTRNGTDLGVEAWLSIDGTEVFNTKGTLKLSIQGASGDVILSYTDPNYQIPEVLTITLKDAKNVYEDNMLYLNGTYTITSETLSALNAIISFNGKEKQQDMTVDLIQGGVNLTTVSMTLEQVPFTAFELPKETDQVYDANTQINEYLSTADIKKYLTNINGKIDIEKINTLIDNVLNSYNY